jgi:hypothetical protein
MAAKLAKTTKCLKLLAHPTRFERVTFAFGGQGSNNGPYLTEVLRMAKGELWVERVSATLSLRRLAPYTRRPTGNPMRASRLRRTPLTPSNEDTTYPVPSIQITARE